MQNEKLWQTRSRGNKLRGYGAQTPNVHLRGQGTDFNYCLFLCPRRRLLGVCAPQRRTSVPRSLFPRSNTLQSPRCRFAEANGLKQKTVAGSGELVLRRFSCIEQVIERQTAAGHGVTALFMQRSGRLFNRL